VACHYAALGFRDFTIRGEVIKKYFADYCSYAQDLGIFDYIQGPESSLERDVIERVAADGQLQAFGHRGSANGCARGARHSAPPRGLVS